MRSVVSLSIGLLLLSGCGDGGIAEPAVDQIAAAEPAAASALQVPADGPLGAVEVYTDLSLSMQPYLAADAEPPVLPRVLEALDGGLGGDVAFFGFGFENDTLQSVTSEPIGTLLRADAYGRQNNDYGALFERFAPDTTGALGPVRVVLTDGVESDPEGGRRFGRAVGAIDAWIRSGGTFAAVLFRAGYSGRYFAESRACAGTAFSMACEDRPLVAFVFAPDARSVDLLMSTIESTSGGLAPETVIRVGGADATLRPLESVVVAGQRRPARLLRKIETGTIGGLDPVVTARIDKKSADDGYVPLAFALDLNDAREPWARLPPETRARFVESLRPRVTAWAVEGRGDDLTLREVDVETRPGEMTTDSMGTRLTLPVRRPAIEGRVRHFAWLVELLPYETAPTLVPADFSTASDCDAGTCDRTLNLVPLLGTVLRDDYVAARAILITEWRE